MPCPGEPCPGRGPDISGSTNRRLRRQLEYEGGALAERRDDVERAAVRLRDRAGDEEAEASARTVAARPAEFLEDQLLLLERDPRAPVAHLDTHDVVPQPHPHLDGGARLRVLDRVVDQIREHLTQPLAV